MQITLRIIKIATIFSLAIISLVMTAHNYKQNYVQIKRKCVLNANIDKIQNKDLSLIKVILLKITI